jgi:diacylglycerol O-acyltransferase / wax synthase
MDRLSASDASLLHGETPEWHMHVTTLLDLDPATMPAGYRFETFRDALALRLRAVPRFRQRVAKVPFGLDRPVWVDLGTFDAEHHIRRVRLPAAGGRRRLFEFAGDIASKKLAHDRPLWECWVIEGPRSRLEALLIKNHHALFDGVGGLESMQAMFDVSAVTQPDPAPAAEPAEPVTDPGQGALELLARSALRAVTVQPLETVKVVRQMARQTVPLGRALLGNDRPLLGLDSPHSPLGGRITTERVTAGVALSMPLIKAIRHKADVKVNDVLLTVIGGALRRYLAENVDRGEHSMIANVAVSTRAAEGDENAGNKFSVMYVTLGTEIEDPAERLAAIHASSVKAKELSEELRQHHETAISAVGPPLLVDALARLYRAAGLATRIQLIGTVGVSNVAGPPLQLFICGAAVRSIFVFGPLMLNSTVNFTAVSNAGSLDVGVTSSPGVVGDLVYFADQMQPALAELAEAFGLPT